ncbi:EAL domain-containing protein [Thiomicrorhabdus lithotrophica]|uniref:EAL domain-containing protein n=1 Tax=Thiomicrorhabdus lithotrophica TaxID=2949997 RepID=UPI0037DC5552
MVQATLQTVHSLKIDTIAKGIEKIAQFTVLKSLECDGTQGYWDSKPFSFNHLVRFITKKHN